MLFMETYLIFSPSFYFYQNYLNTGILFMDWSVENSSSKIGAKNGNIG